MISACAELRQETTRRGNSLAPSAFNTAHGSRIVRDRELLENSAVREWRQEVVVDWTPCCPFPKVILSKSLLKLALKRAVSMLIGRLRAYGLRWKVWAQASKYRSKKNKIGKKHRNKKLLFQTEDGDYIIHDAVLDMAKYFCLLYTSPSPRDKRQSRMPSSA